MARQRSITIYAENESEFENIISSTDLPQKKNKCIRDNTQYDTDDEDDLGSSSQYTIQRKSLSMEEQEKEEESKLIEKISKMNLKYKEGSIDDLTDEEENQTHIEKFLIKFSKSTLYRTICDTTEWIYQTKAAMTEEDSVVIKEAKRRNILLTKSVYNERTWSYELNMSPDDIVSAMMINISF